MRIKFCGIRNDQDLDAALSASPDAVGFLVGQVHPSADFILACTAGRLARKLPPFTQPWLVTHLTRPGDILEIVADADIFNIQIHGESTPDELAAIRDRLPSSAKIIRTIHPEPYSVFSDYLELVPFVNGFLIDSRDPKSGRVGGTGMVGSWPLAARIVQESSLPIILAGGLSPLNVAKAIERVHPFAVDVNTGVKDPFDRSESPMLCRAFADAARGMRHSAE